jgi:hypothetical protein
MQASRCATDRLLPGTVDDSAPLRSSRVSKACCLSAKKSRQRSFGPLSLCSAGVFGDSGPTDGGTSGVRLMGAMVGVDSGLLPVNCAEPTAAASNELESNLIVIQMLHEVSVGGFTTLSFHVL